MARRARSRRLTSRPQRDHSACPGMITALDMSPAASSRAFNAMNEAVFSYIVPTGRFDQKRSLGCDRQLLSRSMIERQTTRLLATLDPLAPRPESQCLSPAAAARWPRRAATTNGSATLLRSDVQGFHYLQLEPAPWIRARRRPKRGGRVGATAAGAGRPVPDD